MALRAIPEPKIGPFPRKKKADLKPLVQVPSSSLPTKVKELVGKPGGNETETKPGRTAEKTAKAEEINVPPRNEARKRQHLPLPDEAEKIDGIPPVFQPVDVLTALSSANPAVATVMLRQLHDMEGPMPDTSSGAVAMIDKIEQGIKNGEDVTSLANQIAVHIMSGDEHNELLMRLHDSVDRERANEILKSRSKMEDFWHGCMRRSDLNIIEGMALTGYFNSQLERIFGRIERKQAKGEPSSGRDPLDLVSKINVPTQLQQKELQRKFDLATPQEREILRKLGFKMERALAARITKTTTETVEIVQAPDGTIPPS